MAESAPPKPGWFQHARDWTAFVISVGSAVTSVLALWNTLGGPRPFLLPLAGQSVAIFRSDQFHLGDGKTAAVQSGLPFADEHGQPTMFPVLLVPVSLRNRAAPPYTALVTRVGADLVISKGGTPVFSAPYTWFYLTTSDAIDDDAKVSHLRFRTADQIALTDLPGLVTWSHEVLLIPSQTYAGRSWDALGAAVRGSCDADRCQGELRLRVETDDLDPLTTLCRFEVSRASHVTGALLRDPAEPQFYYTAPTCDADAAVPRPSLVRRIRGWIDGF